MDKKSNGSTKIPTSLCYIWQLCRLLSISIVCTEKDSSPHFRERTLANEAEGGDQTLGNEVYRMPHPIWYKRFSSEAVILTVMNTILAIA